MYFNLLAQIRRGDESGEEKLLTAIVYVAVLDARDAQYPHEDASYFFRCEWYQWICDHLNVGFATRERIKKHALE